MKILTKIISLYLTIFVVSNLLSQEVKISLKVDTVTYLYKEDNTPINFSYSIENTTNNTIYFVLNKKTFGFFSSPNQYDFNFRRDEPNLDLEETIFDPRLIVFKPNADTLSLDIHGGACSYYDMSSKIVQKQLYEEDQLKQSIKNDSLKAFEKYRDDNHLQNKSIDWVANVKYINDNIIMMKPHEIIQITTPVDFYNYYYYPIDKRGIGYFLPDDSYKIVLKIHSDPKLIEEYLTAKTISKLKKENAIPLQQNYFSNTINLTVNHQ